VRRLWTVLGAAVLLVTACSSNGPSQKARAEMFCARLERLSTNDPFRAFGDRATAKEIESAFVALVARSKALADSAPDEVRPTARDYAKAAKALDSLMAGAGYDGAAVDARAYRAAQNDYTAAAASLENYLASSC
jgi:hypothetical protein